MPEVKRNLTGINRSPGNNGRDWIVVHNVGTAPTAAGSAYANTQYFAGAYRGASAHYFIDDGDVVWQCVDDADTSWAVGDAPSRNGCYNSNSISIEVCGDGEFSAKRRENLRWLVGTLMRRHGVDAAHVVRHYDVTGKQCPARYAGEGNGAWRELHAYITGAAGAAGEDDDMPTPEEIWNYKITDPEGNTYPAYQHLSWGRHYAKNAPEDVWAHDIPDTYGDDPIPAWQLQTWARTYGLENYGRLARMEAQVTALTEAVKALSTMQGGDPAAIVKAVESAVAAKLEDLDVSVQFGKRG